ncbi:efflux RND transporter periplasmic adaptor subunit [Paraburkholderia edwinii]|uniref:Efflux RND transporter periplasmic adaptor subunit n=1 Tax=Paraburkholderia edwinii TaxID=2861782 RepID=A0ABX8URW0_9BURK|nr:efflux RND transporter periplasmic adaptor subunit [Paraburkholderia edwinii]QYD71062.1 efflux RND transporter periplasmic adaptor subunit [Paraburkholderia edwinii]
MLRFAAIGSIALVFSACRNPEGSAASAPPLPTVGVATVMPKTVQEWDQFNGRVSAIDTVELRPRVSGYVERVVYKEGDDVRKGDVLFIIDQRPYRDALASAEAQLAHARATAALALAQDRRAQTLIQSKAISVEEVETRHATFEQSNADVQAAEAAVATARLNLGFTEVRSPIDGRAGRAMLTIGNLAQADQSLLTTVVSQNPMYVYFDADEHSYLRYLERAKKAGGGSRHGAAQKVQVGLANEDGFPHAGTVNFLDNQVDAATGTIRARAVVPNPDRILTPGLYAHVQFPGSDQYSALLIDEKAVLTDQNRQYVYVLGPGDKALRKDVTLGRTIDGLRVVESGLSAGDKVIVTGLQRVYFPGAPVKPTPASMGKPAATADATHASVNAAPTRETTVD